MTDKQTNRHGVGITMRSATMGHDSDRRLHCRAAARRRRFVAVELAVDLRHLRTGWL